MLHAKLCPRKMRGPAWAAQHPYLVSQMPSLIECLALSALHCSCLAQFAAAVAGNAAHTSSITRAFSGRAMVALYQLNPMSRIRLLMQRVVHCFQGKLLARTTAASSAPCTNNHVQGSLLTASTAGSSVNACPSCLRSSSRSSPTRAPMTNPTESVTKPAWRDAQASGLALLCAPACCSPDNSSGPLIAQHPGMLLTW